VHIPILLLNADILWRISDPAVGPSGGTPQPMAETGTVSGDDAVRPKRAAATALDMVRSLGLILLIIAATLIFVPDLIHPGKSSRVQPVSYQSEVRGFQQVTGKPALVPADLPDGWYANSARLTPKRSNATLYIGWVTPTERYAALYESTLPRITLGKPRPGDRTVRRTIGTLNVVITGSASEQEMAELVAALRRT
jgi:hypothetical protein